LDVLAFFIGCYLVLQAEIIKNQMESKTYNCIAVPAPEYIASRALYNEVKKEHTPLPDQKINSGMCKCLKLLIHCKIYQTLSIFESVKNDNNPIKRVKYDDNENN